MSWHPSRLIAEYQLLDAESVPAEMRGVDHFDHLFAYTRNFSRVSDMVATSRRTRMTALWLTSYLAHWGMFRGSSALKSTNVLFFDHLAITLLNARCGLLVPLFNVGLEDIQHLKKGVFAEVVHSISAFLKNHGVSATATLVSKLILGCTNTVPGYDRYVQRGLKRLQSEEGYMGVAAFSESGLRELSEWFQEQSWPSVVCKADAKLRIPSARLADMALTAYGGADVE